MEIYKRKAISEDLNKYEIVDKSNNFIEVIEWINGEGWDIITKDKMINLTRGELVAINYLTQTLDLHKD